MSSAKGKKTGTNRVAVSSAKGGFDNLSKAQKDINRNKFLLFLHDLVGVEVMLLLIDGRKFRGCFYFATPFEGKKYELAIKVSQRVDENDNAVQDETVPSGSTLIFSFDDIARMTVSKKKYFANLENDVMKTDTAISTRRAPSSETRDLSAVDSSWLDNQHAASLESAKRESNIGNWNQFEANKRLYNVKSSYDENLYTKKLDKSLLSQEQIQLAESIAKAIEHSTSTNIHLLEERGQAVQHDMDEEDLYSGVMRPADTEGKWKRGVQGGGSPRPRDGGSGGAKSASRSPGSMSAAAGGAPPPGLGAVHAPGDVSAPPPAVPVADKVNAWSRGGTVSIISGQAASSAASTTAKAQAPINSARPSSINGEKNKPSSLAKDKDKDKKDKDNKDTVSETVAASPSGEGVEVKLPDADASVADKPKEEIVHEAPKGSEVPAPAPADKTTVATTSIDIQEKEQDESPSKSALQVDTSHSTPSAVSAVTPSVDEKKVTTTKLSASAAAWTPKVASTNPDKDSFGGKTPGSQNKPNTPRTKNNDNYFNNQHANPHAYGNGMPAMFDPSMGGGGALPNQMAPGIMYPPPFPMAMGMAYMPQPGMFPNGVYPPQYFYPQMPIYDNNPNMVMQQAGMYPGVSPFSGAVPMPYMPSVNQQYAPVSGGGGRTGGGGKNYKQYQNYNQPATAANGASIAENEQQHDVPADAIVTSEDAVATRESKDSGEAGR